MKNIFYILGMTCPACAKLVGKRLQKIAGVKSVDINVDGKAVLTSNADITKEAVETSLADSEFKVK